MSLVVARALLVASLLPCLASAGDTTTQRVPVSGRGALELTVPSSWRSSVRWAEEGPTLRLEPAEGAAFVLMVTPFAVPRRDTAEETRARARRIAESMREKVAPGAVEKTIAIERLQGGRNPVLWIAATDRAPGPGEHERLVQGTAAAGKLVVTFTLLHHAKDPPERAVVLQAMAGARHVDEPPPPRLEPFALALPGSAWAALVDLPGFELEEVRKKPDGSGIAVMGENASTGLVVSLFVERIAGAADEKACRSLHFDRALASPFEKSGVKRTERKGMALGEYLIPRAEGVEIRQKHVNAYLAREGACVDLHVSKVRHEPKDEALFEGVLRTLRLGAAPR